jgi:hypothetical protein
MSNTTYNGWTNYATWRVNLELIDDIQDKETFFGISEYTEAYELAKYIEQYVEECLSNDMPNELTLSYAMAFIAEVNWYEIAQHLIEDVTYENQ